MIVDDDDHEPLEQKIRRINGLACDLIDQWRASDDVTPADAMSICSIAMVRILEEVRGLTIEEAVREITTTLKNVRRSYKRSQASQETRQ